MSVIAAVVVVVIVAIVAVVTIVVVIVVVVVVVVVVLVVVVIVVAVVAVIVIVVVVCRDTTVQSLTVQPSVHGGVIVYEDSPLVRAVKQGHVLVIDEADKAPTNVTCVLKTLLEAGEMHLADGRRIISRMYQRRSLASPSIRLGKLFCTQL